MLGSPGLRPSQGASLAIRDAVIRAARSAGAESAIRDGALTRVSGERMWDRPWSVAGLSQELAGAEMAEYSIVLQAHGDLLLLQGCICWVHRGEKTSTVMASDSTLKKPAFPSPESSQITKISTSNKKKSKKFMCIARDEDRTLVVTLQLSLTGPQLTRRQLGDLAALPCGVNQLTFMVYKGAAKGGGCWGGVEFNSRADLGGIRWEVSCLSFSCITQERDAQIYLRIVLRERFRRERTSNLKEDQFARRSNLRLFCSL